MNKFLCAIPCYNEEINLPSLFEDLETNQIPEHFEIIFIDDGSKDSTKSMIEQKGYRVVSHEKNMGYGQAVKTAFQFGKEHDFSYFAIFPGDHQRSASDLLKMQRLIIQENADAIVGSKFHIYSKKHGPIGRKYGNRMFSGLAKYGWGSDFDDVLSGFKIYRIATVNPFFDHLPENYGLDITFSYIASQYNLKIIAIPVNCKYNQHTSKMRSTIITSLMMILTLFRFIISHRIPQFLRPPANRCLYQKQPSIYNTAAIASVPGSMFFVMNWLWFGTVPWIKIGPLNTILIIMTGFVLTITSAFFMVRGFRKYSRLPRSLSSLMLLGIFVIGLAPLKQIRSPDGDAPHYLTAAVSLAEDFDLLTQNNYQKRAHIRFSRDNTEIWELPDRRQKKNRQGSLQFWPSPGTAILAAPFSLFAPSLLLPFFASLLMFFSLAGIWQLHSRREDEQIWKVLLYASCPVIAFTNQYFPDMLGFCFLSLALTDAIALKKQARSCLWLAFLPWIKPYFGILSLGLYAGIVLDGQRSFGRIARISAVPLLSLASLMIYNANSWASNSLSYLILGDIYQTTLKYFSFNSDYYGRLAGLLFSPVAGIFWAFPAIVLLFKGKNRSLTFPLAIKPLFCLALFLFLTVTAFEESHGGWCPRGRIFLPFLPLVLLIFDRITYSKKVKALVVLTFLASLPAYIYAVGSLPWEGLANPFGIITYYVNMRWWAINVPKVAEFIMLFSSYRSQLALFLLVLTLLISGKLWLRSIVTVGFFRKKNHIPAQGAKGHHDRIFCKNQSYNQAKIPPLIRSQKRL